MTKINISPFPFRRKIFYVLLSIFTFSFFIEANATIRFVSKIGNPTPPYITWETASDSIQKCINICDWGDTIYVGNGEYKESLIINIELSIIGLSMDSTIINGINLSAITIDTYENLHMENFHLIGKGDIPLTVVLFSRDMTKNKNKFNNIRLENSKEGLGYHGGEIKNSIFTDLNYAISTGSLLNQDTFYIENNIITSTFENGGGIHNIGGGTHYIYNNIILGMHEQLYTGIYLWSDKYCEIKNNLIANYHRFTLLRSEGAFDSAIVTNNIFTQSNLNGILGNVQITPGEKTLFRNNIIAYTYRRPGIIAYNNLNIDYNLFWKTGMQWQGSVINGGHNITADPMFVRDTIPVPGGSYDFHLQKYSPAIDKGDPEILDVDSTRSDIGMYGGPLGMVYSYIDLPPRPPINLRSTVDTTLMKIKVTWSLNTEPDFKNYNIYKDTLSGFIPSILNKYGTSDTTLFEDTYLSPPVEYYYKITAVDSGGNESAAVEEEKVVVTDVNEIITETITEYSLYQNYPNPFNPGTKIGYSIKEYSYVKMMVYDIKGELIKVIVNEEKPAGYYEAEFNTTELGLSSGIYIYRIEVIGKGNIPKYSDMKKMILLK